MQRQFVSSCVLVFLLACGQEGTRVADEKPGTGTSLLFIIVDTLRADHLGAWGYEHPTSPVIDELAATGVRFSHFFSNCSWTRPSVATMLTGLYPRETGIYEEKWDSLDESFHTLPELLHEAGYLTLGVTSNPTINEWFGFAQGFDEYLGSTVVWAHMEARGNERQFRPGVTEMDTADMVTDRALELIDRFPDETRRQPFYLQLLYIDPHTPREPPAGLVTLMQESGSREPRYDGEIRFADAEIGRLLEGLEQRGLLENTLIVLTSDHGEGLGDHPAIPFSSLHGSTLYDSTLHVPLIFRHPALTGGRVIDELASAVDLLPTLLDLVGLTELGASAHGRSLAGPVKGEGEGGGDAPLMVFAETDFRINNKIGVRTSTHKLIRNLDCDAYQSEGAFEGRELSGIQRTLLGSLPVDELYVLREGMREGNPDVNAMSEERRAILRELAAKLDEWDRTFRRRAPLRRDPEDVLTLGDGTVVAPNQLRAGESPDAATIEQLKALGYLGGD